MDKIIFGDNQFLGINHRSIEKSKNQKHIYSSTDNIYNSLQFVNDTGIKSFMFTTHDQFEPVFKKIAKNGDFSDFKLIPCIPYAHKYSNSLAKFGIIGAIRKFVPVNISSGIQAFKTLLLNDPIPLMKLLIDSEMKMLNGLNIQAIFLQNVITDLLLGLDMHSLYFEFLNYVESKYKLKAGFITMNYVKLNHILVNKLKISNPLICSNINKIGFRMNPDKTQVEKILNKNNSYNIGMSVFASGSIKPSEAIEYIKSIKGINSVLFGATKREHIIDTYNLLKNF